MNRKVSIVISLLVAATFAGALIAPAEAALVKIIHLDCAQWHARLALLAKRKAHPRPPGAHHFAGRRHRVRIHFVCDCRDGAADDSALDDLPGDGGPAAGAAGGARDPSALSVLGSSFGSSAAFDWPAFSSGVALGAGAGGSSSPTASDSSGPVAPDDGSPFNPATSSPTSSLPLGPNPLEFNPRGSVSPARSDDAAHTQQRTGAFDLAAHRARRRRPVRNEAPER